MKKRLSLSCALVAGIISLDASPAQAAPPPPPKAADLQSLQTYILGLDQGRTELYRNALAADVNVVVSGKVAAKSKSDWMSSVLSRFVRGYNQNVTVEHVYYGGTTSPDGSYESRAILLERVDRVFGDCCVFHRVETLTFRNGLVASIDRSAELDLQLKPDGHRQDGLPGTP